MYSGLVHNRVRHFRLIVRHILRDPHPVNVLRFCRIWVPERRLVHPIGFTLDLVCKTKGLKHLHRPDAHAICLTLFNRAVFRLDDHRRDFREASQLRCKAKACRSAACDEDVNGRRNGVGIGMVWVQVLQGCFDVRITGPEPVNVVLHSASPQGRILADIDIYTY